MSGKKPLRNGQGRSQPGERDWKTEPLFPSAELERILGEVFDDFRDDLRKTESAADYETKKFDFVFHMTDWLGDLKELNELYEHPERADVQKTCILLIGLLSHVIPHLNAAGRLFLDEIPDPFAPAAPPAEPEPCPDPKTKRARKRRTKEN
jgi:hypothetical protein